MSQRPTSHRRPGLGRGIFIGRYFGIDFYLDLSWFMVATLVTYELQKEIFPRWVYNLSAHTYLGMGMIAALLFFICILLHELGHSLVSQRCGIPVPRITLLFIGGVAEISREPDDAKSELKIALGGPAVSILLSGFFFVASLLFKQAHFLPGEAVCHWLAITNSVLVIFNMIPGYPLDGGRVLRALIWHYTGKLRQATFITSRIGIAFSWTLIAIGLISVLRRDWSGLILLVIGFFLKGAAETGYANALQRVVLAGVTVRDIMTKDPVTVPASLPLNLAVDDVFLTNHHVAFPVVGSDDEFRGLLRIDHLKGVSREKWPYVTAGDVVADSDTGSLTLDANAPAARAMRKLLVPESGRLAVTDHGKLVGIITRHDILHFIKVHVELEE
jgi:Zn-dependent protease/predicted transcriptional regulator